jgi:VIT1/CCC1 family predicted Fe2+/Mn2+ transporter
MATPQDIKRYRKYLAEEVDGLYIYQQLSAIEEDQTIAGVYTRLAESEQRHLDLWQEQLRQDGGPTEPPSPSLRARVLMWLARKFGPELVLPVLKTFENDANTMYAHDPVAISAGLPREEAAHARLFSAIASSPGHPPGSVIARLEARHRSCGGSTARRAAVLGANDGLTSNLALVAGIAGAAAGNATVILAGVAGLLAGASSMALGEWISVTSAREAAQAQLQEEREELRLFPEAEEEELALIYQAKGLSELDANRLAKRIIGDHETALGTLAREELGIVPEELGSPWTAAMASFALFALGALVPVLPFLIGSGFEAVIASAICSAIALFGLGAAITLLTGRSPLYAGSRQAVLGLAAAALTFVVGSVIGGVAGI